MTRWTLLLLLGLSSAWCCWPQSASDQATSQVVCVPAATWSELVQMWYRLNKSTATLPADTQRSVTDLNNCRSSLAAEGEKARRLQTNLDHLAGSQQKSQQTQQQESELLAEVTTETTDQSSGLSELGTSLKEASDSLAASPADSWLWPVLAGALTCAAGIAADHAFNTGPVLLIGGCAFGGGVVAGHAIF